jgi:uncharacterized protein YdbL (DUF1318 family)
MKRMIATIALVLASLPALALDFQQARQQGIVGEKADGYVVPLAKSDEAIRLATDVNAKRKMEYLRISKENGQPVDVVGKLAAQQIVQNLPKGATYMDASGNWVQK